MLLGHDAKRYIQLKLLDNHLKLTAFKNRKSQKCTPFKYSPAVLKPPGYRSLRSLSFNLVILALQDASVFFLMPVNQQAHICPQKSILLEDLPRDNHFMNSAMEPPEDDRSRILKSRWIELFRIADNLTTE